MPRLASRPVAGLALLVLASLTLPAVAGEGSARPTPLGIGATAPSFEAQDIDGRSWSLASARAITSDQALEAVRAAAKAYGGGDLKAEDPLDGLAGLRKGDAVDPALRAAFAGAAGKPFGLMASAKTAEGLKTFGDVAAWIQKASSAPIVFMCWSPKCPTSQLYEERIEGMFAETGARFYALACNYNDTDQEIRDRLQAKRLPYVVLLDRDQRISDVLGGRKTPHAFVLDDKNVVRYSGAIDSDPAGLEPAEKRVTYLRDALTATAAGHGLEILMTTPKG